jgi:tRNA(Ser,Leu) C12 N-acetylase TAN1
LESELENIKLANKELKETIQKLMESHLAEKKRMVVKFEEETENYAKYYEFYHDNFEKLQEMKFQIEEMAKFQEQHKKLLQDQQRQQLREKRNSVNVNRKE